MNKYFLTTLIATASFLALTANAGLAYSEDNPLATVATPPTSDRSLGTAAPTSAEAVAIALPYSEGREPALAASASVRSRDEVRAEAHEAAHAGPQGLAYHEGPLPLGQ